jgi:hypothetical protein
LRVILGGETQVNVEIASRLTPEIFMIYQKVEQSSRYAAAQQETQMLTALPLLTWPFGNLETCILTQLIL